MFFVIHNSDGDTTVEMLRQDELEERLNEQYYGDSPRFLDRMPDEHDTNYWPEGMYLIIKGEIVAPRPEQVVTRYAL